MSLNVFNGCWLSLTVFLVTWSCCIPLTVSCCCWPFLAVSSGSGCFSLSLQSPGTTTYLSLSLIFAGCLSLSLRSHTVATCVYLSLIVDGFLSLSLWSHGVAACLSLSSVVAGSLSLSPMVACYFHCLSDPMELLHISHWLSLLLALSHGVSRLM